MKKLFLAVMLAIGFATAQAQVTGNLSVTSDYRFRGISQSQNSLAVQGGVDYTHSTGLYVGNWNSSVSSQQYTNGSGVESDLYAGYKKDIYKGITVDVGSHNYFYPRARNQTNNKRFNTSELYAAAGYDAKQFGAYTVKYNRSLSNYFGVSNSDGTEYIQFDAAVPVPLVSKLSFIAHAGRTDVDNNSQLNYNDYATGFAYEFNSWTVSAKYYWTASLPTGFAAANTINGHNLTKSAGVIALTKTFN